MLGKEDKPCLGLNYLVQPGPDLTFCWKLLVCVFFHKETVSVSPQSEPVALTDIQHSEWVVDLGISPLNFENRAGYKTEIAKLTWDPMVSSKL